MLTNREILERILDMLMGQWFADWYANGGEFGKFIMEDDSRKSRIDILDRLGQKLNIRP
jgi:hypothetical protein